MKVATHLVFAECCWFALSAIGDVQYETPAVLAAAATSLLPDADYPKSWLGYQLGGASEWLHERFGHRSFLHSLLALALVAVVLGLPLWWLVGRPAPALAVFVGYGSHLFADMMTLGGVQLFWPSTAIAVFPESEENSKIRGAGIRAGKRLKEEQMAILDLTEASEFLGADPQDVRYWASHGQLPARNIGGEWYFSDTTLTPYLQTYGGHDNNEAEVAEAPNHQ